jgi:hypothetical protein
MVQPGESNTELSLEGGPAHGAGPLKDMKPVGQPAIEVESHRMPLESPNRCLI